MTDEQINAAIAEACGWTKEDGVYVWTSNGIDCTYYELWDWANDLNAMYLAEAILSEDQLCRMAREIERNDTQWYFRATARQRAEAFLRTLGKWEEAAK